MKPRAWAWLIARDVLSQKWRHALLIVCITLSSALFGLTYSTVTFLRGEIRPRLRELFPERRVIVRPTSGDILFFRLEGPRITDEIVADFRSMPEVEHLYPQLSASFPVSASFEMESFDVGFETDIILFGVEEGLVAGNIELRDADFHPAGEGERLPVVISEYFLDAYNLGLAESSGMPKLSRSAVVGIEFDIILGESTTALAEVDARPRVIPARVVGLTPNPLLFGVTAPLENIRAYNSVYTPAKRAAFTALHVDLASPEGADAVRSMAGKHRLSFEAQKEVLDRYMKVVGTLEGFLLFGFSIVGLLAAVGVFTTCAAAVRERRPAWGLHRSTGLHRRGVLMIALGHAVFAGIPSGLLGAGICHGISRLLSWIAGPTIQQLSIFATSPFVYTPSGMILTFLFGLLFALVPILFFAIPVCRARPIDLLAERSL